jgi:hypothetical protein
MLRALERTINSVSEETRDAAMQIVLDHDPLVRRMANVQPVMDFYTRRGLQLDNNAFRETYQNTFPDTPPLPTAFGWAYMLKRAVTLRLIPLDDGWTFQNSMELCIVDTFILPRQNWQQFTRELAEALFPGRDMRVGDIDDDNPLTRAVIVSFSQNAEADNGDTYAVEFSRNGSPLNIGIV